MSEPRFRFFEWILWIVIVLFVVMLCVSLGSVQIPLAEVAENLGNMLSGNPAQGAFANIIRNVRLPRVLCAALTGAALSFAARPCRGSSRIRLLMGRRSASAPALLWGRRFPFFWVSRCRGASFPVRFGFQSSLRLCRWQLYCCLRSAWIGAFQPQPSS
ncbi:MAG: iron chelate uptake ABC transporter family permease subunit [Clostridia bacterium]|nr:iron chelate uptake ABC transporter family permease subunit [Clostridia bacterium]